MKMSKSARLATAGVALLAACSMGFAGTAFAADPQGSVAGVSQEAANPALINPSANVELDIHKYLGAATGQKNDGTEQTITGVDPLEGVNFDIYSVSDANGNPLDLKTNAGWQAANTIHGATITEADLTAGSITVNSTTFKLTKETTETTDAKGVATFEKDNGVGVYVVAENLASSGTITNVTTGAEVNKAKVQGSAPFVVTLPITNPNTRNSWMYTVNVYPKNQQTESPHKSLSEAAADKDAAATEYKVGQTLTYEVSQKVPYYGDVVGAPVDGKYTAPDGKIDHNDISYFYVTDTFDSNLTVGTDPVASVKLGDTTLTKGTDYVVTIDGQKVIVGFTNDGLDKLAASKGGTVTVTYNVTVKSIPTTGEINNTANTIPAPVPSQGGEVPNYTPTTPPDNPPDNPSNKVVAKYGKIRVTKVDGTDTNKKLAGAEFSVYRATATKGADGKFTYSCDNTANEKAITTFTTNDQGQGVSEDLVQSNWYNDGLEKAADGNNNGYLDGAQYAEKYGEIQYCLVETKAPTGYQLLAQPVLYRITETGDVEGQTYNWATVNDQPDNYGNRLPLTGGTGVAILVIAGLALVGGGVMVYERNRRKNLAK